MRAVLLTAVFYMLYRLISSRNTSTGYKKKIVNYVKRQREKNSRLVKEETTCEIRRLASEKKETQEIYLSPERQKTAKLVNRLPEKNIKIRLSIPEKNREIFQLGVGKTS